MGWQRAFQPGALTLLLNEWRLTLLCLQPRFVTHIDDQAIAALTRWVLEGGHSLKKGHIRVLACHVFPFALELLHCDQSSLAQTLFSSNISHYLGSLLEGQGTHFDTSWQAFHESSTVRTATTRKPCLPVELAMLLFLISAAVGSPTIHRGTSSIKLLVRGQSLSEGSVRRCKISL